MKQLFCFCWHMSFIECHLMHFDAVNSEQWRGNIAESQSSIFPRQTTRDEGGLSRSTNKCCFSPYTGQRMQKGASKRHHVPGPSCLGVLAGPPCTTYWDLHDTPRKCIV